MEKIRAYLNKGFKRHKEEEKKKNMKINSSK